MDNKSNRLKAYERYSSKRDEAQMTDYAVAKEVEITQSVLSDWKKGRSMPKADKMLGISRAVNTTMEYLIEGDEECD